MNEPIPPAPPIVEEAAPGIDAELAALLSAPFVAAWSREPRPAEAQALHGRLAARVAQAQRAAAAMRTVRHDRAARRAIADGVTLQPLYRADRPQAMRPGEPLRASLIELAPGARFMPGAGAPEGLGDETLQREWLLLDGAATLGDEALAPRDHHLVPAGQAGRPWASERGALLFLREAPLPARPGEQARTLRDAETPWPEFAPGIRRRVLWQRGSEAALLYHARPGAQVPAHRHGHDEECLMLAGELFLDDLLLQPLDYQLAPAGTGHRLTETDTGVVIYAHGDLDFDFVA